MRYKFLLATVWMCMALLLTNHTLQAQSKEELNELLNSPSATDKGKAKSKKAKPAKAPQATSAAEKEEPAKTEKQAPAKQEPVKEEKAAAPAAEPQKETVKEKAQPAPTQPAKTEPAVPAPAQTAKEEKPTAPKAEPTPEKTQPAKLEKTEPAKTEPVKQEKAPAAKSEPVAPPKEEIAKEKEQPQPAKTEPKQSEPVKQETQAPTTTPAVKSGSTTLKELPSPQSIGWRKNKKLGDKLTAKGSIYNSLDYYAEALAKKPKKTFLNQKLADGHFLLRNYAAANTFYKTLSDLDSVKHKNPLALYQYALTEKYLGRYAEAKTVFEKFNRVVSGDDKWSEWRKNASREAQGCDLGLQLQANTDMPAFKVEHLSEKINQPFTDYAPILASDNQLYYGSWISDSVMLDGKREKYAVFSRIYQSNRTGSDWGQGTAIASDVNAVNYHTGNPALTPDGKTMYYTQCAQDETGRMLCNIYKSNWANGTWSSGEKLDGTVNKEGTHTTQPAVGKNEAGDLVLYFSADRNPVRGMDIYAAKINANGSTEAARPVTIINTRGDEATPSFDFKTNTLYFASNGHINIGGYDIFKSNLSNGEWSEPTHMGLPINSSVDDMYFSWDEKQGEGFVVSNRPEGFGQKSATCCDDIYSVTKTKLNFAVKGLLQNADNNYKTIENGLAQLYDEKEGKEIKTVYAADGSYFFDLEKEKAYKIIARKKGFEDMLLSVSTVGKRSSDTVTLDFTMKSIPQALSHVGETIGEVYWEFNKDMLSAGAPDTLNKVTQFMTDNPQYVLEVGSHTDGKGTEEYNLALSQRRSDAVLKYLLSKKIRKFRLISKAYGESMPRALNEDPAGVDNPAGRDKNRRTEFKVVTELSADEITAAEEAEAKAKAAKPATKSKTNK
ncbi:MAG: OmpA family protein [Bacteroidetes bacterium]|nr:OmpA family protein [Bacteroidota bacterium]